MQVRAEGARRIYALDAGALSQLDRWLDQFRGAWDQPLDALETRWLEASASGAEVIDRFVRLELRRLISSRPAHAGH